MGSGSDGEDETRQQIMRATYHALCKQGYANLTTQDIADETETSKSLLHYHYDTKEDLLLAFIDSLIGWIGDRLAETETEEPEARLLEFIDRFVINPNETRRETFAQALLELRLQAVHNPDFRVKLAAHYEGNVATVAGIISDGIEADVFRPVDATVVGEAIYTSMVGARMYQVTLGSDEVTRRMRDTLEKFVVENLVE